MTLKEIQIGKSCIITRVGGEGALRQHFLDMGVIPGAEVTVVKYAPMGDPVELLIHGYSLTLRLDDAAKIDVDPISEKEIIDEQEKKANRSVHPGLGEGGKFHPKGSGDHYPRKPYLLLRWLEIRTVERQRFLTS